MNWYRLSFTASFILIGLTVAREVVTGLDDHWQITHIKWIQQAVRSSKCTGLLYSFDMGTVGIAVSCSFLVVVVINKFQFSTRNRYRMVGNFIGASMSEPHTSGSAMCTCVYTYVLVCWRLYTVNYKWAHSNISLRSILHTCNMWDLPAECKKTTEVETRMGS